MRGYNLNLVGPLSISENQSEDGDPLSVRAAGGEALVFFSEELTYNTPYFGLGVTPFVDGGWIWQDADQLLDTDVVISAGLGLSLDSPIGYFRIDWARPVLDDAVDRALGDYTGDTRAFLRGRLLNEWTFRFGRMF